MKTKNIIITCIISAIITILFVIDFVYNKDDIKNAYKAYVVYLDGEKIGQINDKDSLYNLINKEQEQIKKEYKVDGVYPPDGFNLIEVNTYKNEFTSVNDIYRKIEQLDNFTIKGYSVTIKSKDKNEPDKVINVLDKKIFEDSLKNFVMAFISDEQYKEYLSNDKKTLTDIGSIINTMYFNETITIKEGFISVKEKIYTSVESLSQYLLFGDDSKMDSYTVKLGDDIVSISNEHKLNTQEFIIANPSYKNENNVLVVGSKVNVTLLNPALTFVYEVYRIGESITPFTKKTVVDPLKPYSYSEISQSGVSGITLNHENFQVINGEQSSEIKIASSEVVRPMVEQITVVGKRYNNISGGYENISGDWGWPTNRPSIITSPYGYRWGVLHDGMDISGTGKGSPIYAVADGKVVSA
ncbi:MAG: G5 domain-containing protein, partial [Clostridia bacterium]